MVQQQPFQTGSRLHFVSVRIAPFAQYVIQYFELDPYSVKRHHRFLHSTSSLVSFHFEECMDFEPRQNRCSPNSERLLFLLRFHEWPLDQMMWFAQVCLSNFHPSAAYRNLPRYLFFSLVEIAVPPGSTLPWHPGWPRKSCGARP